MARTPIRPKYRKWFFLDRTYYSKPLAWAFKVATRTGLQTHWQLVHKYIKN